MSRPKVKPEGKFRFSPRRPLGRTGFAATRLGLGDLADRALGLEACAATLRRGLDAGVNLLDTAPAYEDGFSEEVVGAALAGREREAVFVVDKIDHLDQPVAPQVAGSLRRLKLAHVDLFLFHGVSKLADWERLAAPGGGLDELAAEIQAGRARFMGLSSHDPATLRAAIESGRVDAVMFALGPDADPRYAGEILPLARSRGVGTLGFKAFAAGMLVAPTAGYGRPLPADSPARANPALAVADCVNYILTLDPDVALLGLSTPAEQDAAFAAAAAFSRPLDARALAALRARAAVAVQGKGKRWWNPPK